MTTTARAPSGCGHCGAAGLLPLAGRDKWGRCAFCMALALAGNVIGWTLTLSFWLFAPQTRAVLPLLCVSAAFSSVLAGHLIAYLWRRRRPSSATLPHS